MKIIRKVLILSINTDWANELKGLFTENPKVVVDIATTRTLATKLLSDNEYIAVIMEDTFKLKNMDYFLRSIETLAVRPGFVFFCFSDFELYSTISIPEALSDVKFKAYSLPLPKALIEQVVFQEIFPYGSDSSSDFDREFIQVLIKSANRVFGSFELDDLKAQKPCLLTKMDNLNVSIRGKILIKSNFFKGALFVSFCEQTYKNLYLKVVGSPIESIDSTNKDFAGELANMIYGQAKKELDENGVKLDMAIPVLDQSASLSSTSPIFVVPIESSIGTFYIKLAPGLY